MLKQIGLALNKALKTGMYDYINLEAPHNEFDFVTKSGGLSTVYEIQGSYRLIGGQSLIARIDDLVLSLKGLLASPGHRLQFVFVRDPDGSDRDVSQVIMPSIHTIKRLNLEMNSIFAQRKQKMTQITSSERCYMVVTTLHTAIPSISAKEENEARLNKAKGLGIKPGMFAQSPFMNYTRIEDIHSGFSANLERKLKEYIVFKKMGHHEALRAIKREINPDTTSPNWRPLLIGDKVRPRMLKEYEDQKDLSHIMQPELSYQLFTEEPEQHADDPSMVKCGDLVYAPLLVDIPPQECRPFNELFNGIDKEIPWRISLTIDTGHNNIVSKIGSKRAFTSFLKFSSSQNRLISDACDELLALVNNNHVLATASISFATWGRSVKEVKRRKSMIAQSIQSWGYCSVIEEKGDSIDLWVESMPALCKQPISTPFPIPLDEMFMMLPLTRPASPWESGSVLYRTMDDKLFPYQPGSSHQTTWVDLYYAPPGFGKSFKLASDNTALIALAGNTHLPRIGIIDIGPSSANYVNMVKASLPEHKRDLCAAYKIQMTEDFAINPFDTTLGCHYPLAMDRSFLINFISLLLTPAGVNSAQNIPEFSSFLVDTLYKYYDDTPKIYEPGFEAIVDKAVEDIMMNLSETTSWWDVVDALFKADRIAEAGLAQRHAVPNLSDATTVIANDESLTNLFGESFVLGEPLIGFVNRQLSLITRDFVILSQPSIFDTGKARIVSLDLQDVARTGGEQQDKQTGIMYMLARYIICKEFYRDLDSLNEIKNYVNKDIVKKYYAYHKKAIEVEMAAPKKLCMDEYHRTRHTPAVRAQAEVDGREGRKFGVHLAIASQFLDDFTDDLIALATNVYILSKGGTEDTIRAIEEKFKPGPDAIEALRRDVTGPGPEGSTLLYIGKIKGQDIIVTLRLSLGSIEMWAYSTTTDDVILRKKLTDKFGLNKALQILASEYSGGTAKSAIEALVASNPELADGLKDGRTVYDYISDKLTIKFKKHLSVS